MTTTLKATLARLVAERNVDALEALMVATTDRLDRQHVRLALTHARRDRRPLPAGVRVESDDAIHFGLYTQGMDF